MTGQEVISTGKAPGKIILFGEHFVVHKARAIAAALSNKVELELQRSNENKTITQHDIIPDLSNKAISAVLNSMDIKDKFDVYFKGNLPTCGGLGSSAAFCVALARAISNYYSLELNNEQINKHARAGELVFHGTPSGLDDTIATYGGAIEYKKGEDFKKLKIGNSLFMVIGITGKSSPTKKMVEKVHKFKEENPKIFEEMLYKYSRIFESARIALEKGDAHTIGVLMNKNHTLLKKIGVSLDVNEELIKKFKSANPLGAKLTGGGGGGCCIALARDEDHAKEILNSIKPFDGFITQVG